MSAFAAGMTMSSSSSMATSGAGGGSADCACDEERAAAADEPDIPRLTLSPASLAIHNTQQQHGMLQQGGQQQRERPQLRPSNGVHGGPDQPETAPSIPMPHDLQSQQHHRSLRHLFIGTSHHRWHAVPPYSVENYDFDGPQLECLSASSADHLEDGNERDDEASDGDEDDDNDIDIDIGSDGRVHSQQHATRQPLCINQPNSHDPFFESVEASFLSSSRPTCSKTTLISCLSSRSTSPGPMSPLLSDDDWPSCHSIAASLDSALSSLSASNSPTSTQATSIASCSSDEAAPVLAAASTIVGFASLVTVGEAPVVSEPAIPLFSPSAASVSSSSADSSSSGTRVRFKHGCVISEVNLTWAAESYDRAPIDVTQSLSIHRCHSIDVNGADADEEAEHWQVEDDDADDLGEGGYEFGDDQVDDKRHDDERDRGRYAHGWDRDPLVHEENSERIPETQGPSQSGTGSDSLSLCRVQTRFATSSISASTFRTFTDDDPVAPIQQIGDDSDDETAETRTILSASPAAPGTLLTNVLLSSPRSLSLTTSLARCPPSPPLASSPATAATAAFAYARASMQENLSFSQHSLHRSPETSSLPVTSAAEPSTSDGLVLIAPIPEHSPLSPPSLTHDDSSASSIGDVEDDDHESGDWARWMQMACQRKMAALKKTVGAAHNDSSASLHSMLQRPSLVSAEARNVGGLTDSSSSSQIRRASMENASDSEFSHGQDSASEAEHSDRPASDREGAKLSSCAIRRAKARHGMCAMGKFSREQIFECDALGGF